MSFWAELKRRNVVKVGAAYLIVAWLIAQLVDVINSPLNLPDWFDTTVLVLLGIGLPVAVFFAWIFELTPQGIKVTEDVPLEQSIRHLTGQKLNYIVTGLLAAAVVFLVIDRYLFSGDGSPVAAATAVTPPLPTQEPPPAAAPTRQKVAVLPCDNLSPNPNDAYFAAGIHEEILNQLAKIRSLLVVARSSVMQYAQDRPTVPQIARELNATAIMECSVRYAGDDVLVTAQLIDPATDSHLWSDSYPGNLSNLGTIFAMQADIAMNIANALEAEFSPAEQARLEEVPTDSPEAYALLLAARARGPGPNAEQRLELLEQAVALDPEFALAHATMASLLAQATLNLVGGSASLAWRDVEARAAQSAARALALDPNASLAYMALGNLDEISWRWADARRNYARAYELNANEPQLLFRYAWFSMFSGAQAEGLRLAERAVELQPTELIPLVNLSVSRNFAGDIEGAMEACRRVLATNPSQLFCIHGRGMANMRLGDPAAEADAREVERLMGPNRQLALLPQLALIYARFGYSVDVARLVAEVEARGRDTDIGVGTYLTLSLSTGDRTKVREWLDMAIGKIERQEPDAGYYEIINVRLNAFSDPILEEPEFRELRAKLDPL